MTQIIIGLISFTVAAFIFSFALPLMRTLINDLLPNLGSASSFFVLLLPFALFFLLLFAFLRIVGGGGQ